MRFFGGSLAGAGYVVLNVIRVLNIISLLAVIAASSVMLVKTFVVSKFFFFDGCEHVVSIVISTFLIITELPLFKSYFSRNWPLFSHKSGFVMLGAAMLLLGNNVLGNLNKQATSQKSLGLPFWRIVIAAGIVVIVMGTINLFASYIFRDAKIGLTARQVRSHGAVAGHKVDVESKSALKAFHLGQRDSLPSYYSRSVTSKSETSQTPRSRPNISSPINNISSPINNDKDSKPNGLAISPEITVPNLAHHPAMYADRI